MLFVFGLSVAAINVYVCAFTCLPKKNKTPKEATIAKLSPYRIDPTDGLGLDATTLLLSPPAVAPDAAGEEKKKKGSWLGVFSLFLSHTD
jgi:hypothetical protein